MSANPAWPGLPPIDGLLQSKFTIHYIFSETLDDIFFKMFMMEFLFVKRPYKFSENQFNDVDLKHYEHHNDVQED